MLSFQKAASDKTGLGYDFSSPNITSSSTIVFALHVDNVNSENNKFKIEIASENLDKWKSILGAPPKVEKKETRNPRTKKVNNKKFQLKKSHVCHHCGASGNHLGIRINFHHLLLLLEVFSKLSCSFRTWTVSILPPHLRIKSSHKGRVLPKCGRKKTQSDLVTFSLSPFMLVHYLFVLLSCFELVEFFALCVSFMFLFGYFSIFVYFAFHKNKNKILKNQKNTKTVCVCVYWYLYTLDGHWNKVFWTLYLL